MIYDDDDDDDDDDESCTNTNTNTTIDCRQLIWNSNIAQMEDFQTTYYGKFDTILGADVIYTREREFGSLNSLIRFLFSFKTNKTMMKIMTKKKKKKKKDNDHSS